MATQRRRNRQSVSQKKIFGGSKLSSSNDKMTEAKRQTKADAQAFKKDRASGDKDMMIRAFEEGTNYHIGGPNNITSVTNGRINRKTVEDSSNALKSPKASPVPNQVKKKLPPAVQDRQKELEDLKKMEGIDELKKKKGTKA